jgi:hypothetical protein
MEVVGDGGRGAWEVDDDRGTREVDIVPMDHTHRKGHHSTAGVTGIMWVKVIERWDRIERVISRGRA